ncbi:hypothetical protein DL546_003896 [Coniochaeta pulveracea]|uniref:CN hydrolase domain-containing protein n=1 Tax=Coniochaeta pulveracea TaxID=177199 RepID=A0A420YCT1_9PEZI|nr:hypothetical protein DL546_003896 [Coniochaeta pulveracea]
MRTALRTLQAIISPVHLPNQPLSKPLLSRQLLRKMTSQQQPPRYPLLKKPVKIACIQLASGSDKATNLSHARDKILEAGRSGANIVVLPECFNSPYGTEYFSSYAEQLQPLPPSKEQSPSFHALSEAAREAGVYLVGGSIPELAVGRAAGEDKLGGKEAETEKEEGEEKKTYYNTSLIFDPKGELLATHRKVHLFDIDIPGGITFKESDVLSAGNKITLVDLPDYGRIAVAICYDVRFPEMAMVAARRGAFALVYPGAFNMTTGPLHWRLLAQGRAVDNQVMVVDPMAKVLVEAEEGESIVYGELDAETIEKARKGIPLRDQRRFDVYPDISTDERVRLEDELQK